MVTLLQSLGLVAPETIASLAVERVINSRAGRSDPRGRRVGPARQANCAGQRIVILNMKH
jgi:hypothetical protein